MCDLDQPQHSHLQNRVLWTILWFVFLAQSGLHWPLYWPVPLLLLVLRAPLSTDHILHLIWIVGGNPMSSLKRLWWCHSVVLSISMAGYCALKLATSLLLQNNKLPLVPRTGVGRKVNPSVSPYMDCISIVTQMIPIVNMRWCFEMMQWPPSRLHTMSLILLSSTLPSTHLNLPL
jgi:hypothetical protein